MAWHGMNNDQFICYSVFDDQQWAPQASIPGVGSSTGLGMASVLDRLVLA
jgi:hypothetical protein